MARTMIPQRQPQLDPQQRRFVEQATLATQAVLANKNHSQDVVKMASSGPDGMAQVVMSILALIEQRQQIAAEDAPIAAFTILMVLIDFLGKIKAYDVTPETVRQSVAAVMDLVARRYNATDQDIADLDQVFPGISGDIMSRRGQQAEQQAAPQEMPQGGMMPTGAMGG